jgi:hypothetical protein
VTDVQFWIFVSVLFGGVLGSLISTRVDRHFWRTYRYCPTCDRLGDDS